MAMSENIRYTLMFVAVVLLCVGMVALIVISTTVQPQVRKIDCTWSEISPDFTPAMRKACRKA
jgi:hypothetical protein